MLLDAEAVRAELASPTYAGGLWDTDGCAILDPARLAWGLQRACLEAGVRIYEGSPVRAIEPEPGPAGGWSCGPGAASYAPAGLRWAPGRSRPLLRRLRYYVVPVYDYVLMTEPLSAAQLDSIGWRHRQGVGDSANQFHYYRLTADNRILWGGYDAVYYYGGKIADSLDQRPADLAASSPRTSSRRSRSWRACSSRHTWGGVIDTCSRFCAFFGTRRRAAGVRGRVHRPRRRRHPVRRPGHARLALRRANRADRSWNWCGPGRCRSRRSHCGRPSINLTRWSLARADRNEGRRNLWLRTLDRLGLGFDS